MSRIITPVCFCLRRWLRGKGTMVVCHPNTWFGHGHKSWRGHGHVDMDTVCLGREKNWCLHASMSMSACHDSHLQVPSHVCISMFACPCLHFCMSIFALLQVCMSTSASPFACPCLRVCMSMPVSLHVHACMSACPHLCVSMSASLNVHAFMSACPCLHAPMSAWHVCIVAYPCLQVSALHPSHAMIDSYTWDDDGHDYVEKNGLRGWFQVAKTGFCQWPGNTGWKTCTTPTWWLQSAILNIVLQVRSFSPLLMPPMSAQTAFLLWNRDALTSS